MANTMLKLFYPCGDIDLRNPIENPYKLLLEDGKYKGKKGLGLKKNHTMKGIFTFIVKYCENRYVVFLEKNVGHIDIAFAKPVNYAGKIKFSNKGELVWWDNNSGHYKPEKELAPDIASATDILLLNEFQSFETSSYF
ncbi:MAG: hypothetical protein F6K35_14630 [Okeania sp. SIO2H7]|nr:hypothetical protein [Okeania sp. SIO2H7]